MTPSVVFVLIVNFPIFSTHIPYYTDTYATKAVCEKWRAKLDEPSRSQSVCERVDVVRK